MISHPQRCKNCGSKVVYFERFSGPNGEYTCDDCGWSINAKTGENTFPGTEVFGQFLRKLLSGLKKAFLH